MSAAPPAAFVFPGQGISAASLAPVLDRLGDHWVLRRCRELLGAHRTGDDLLRDPAARQPLLVATSLALADEASRRWRPVVAAGHSLGELAAFTYAGALDVDQALRLAAARAACCTRAAAARPGRMLSVIGLPSCDLDQVRAEARAEQPGVLEVAAENGPGEWVLSGDRGAVLAAGPRVRARGGRSRALDIDGGYHSELMRPAMADWQAALDGVRAKALRFPVVSCMDGARHATADDLARLLGAALVAPVRWRAVMAALAEHAPEVVVEVGPGSTLTGLASRSGTTWVSWSECALAGA